MPNKIDIDNITIVLQRPRFPENIGAAARAARNMGIRRLIVVEPENFDLERVNKMATHAAADIVREIEIFQSLPEALADVQYVVGTTARLGRQRHVIHTPSVLAEKLIPISRDNRVAVVFGPEDRGLANEDIQLCHALLNIPTADFSSLNLAQAVMIVCYELHNARIEKETAFTPRLAGRHELEGMYETLKEILVRIDYIHGPNPDYWLNKVRHFFNRLPLRAREVSIIRGVCRQIDWYGKKCFEDGVRRSEVRGQRSEGRGRMSEVGGPRSDVQDRRS